MNDEGDVILFADAAREEVAQLQEGSERRAILECFLEHAVGAENAKSWTVMGELIRARGFNVSKNRFQNTVLKDSRAGRIFIGSTDAKKCPGFFLIRNLNDAEIAMEFYDRRLKATLQNFDQLKALSKRAFGL